MSEAMATASRAWTESHDLERTKRRAVTQALGVSSLSKQREDYT
jgi:hypothetical protein